MLVTGHVYHRYHCYQPPPSRQLLLNPTMMSRSLLILTVVQQTLAGCPFGNPFYFVDIPKVNRVTNVEGAELPDRWIDFFIVSSLNRLVSTELESAGGR